MICQCRYGKSVRGSVDVDKLHVLVEGELHTIGKLDICLAVVALNLGNLCIGILRTDDLADSFGHDARG